jgi:Na+-transporting NADH:ubiquinone oxidoreductase subunit NqrC
VFGWNFENKSDRVKLFLFLLAIFLVVGFAISTFFRFINKEEIESVAQNSNKTDETANQVDSSVSSNDTESDDTESEADGPNDYDQTEKFSEKDLENTKKLASDFVTAFHNYNSNKPTEYLENAKPFMTDALYEKLKKNGRREVLERSYLTAKETEVTPVVNPSSMVIRWNVIVRGEAKSNDGKTLQTEDWYLVGIRKVDGAWKVEDVKVNVPS